MEVNQICARINLVLQIVAKEFVPWCIILIKKEKWHAQQIKFGMVPKNACKQTNPYIQPISFSKTQQGNHPVRLLRKPKHG